LQAQIPAERLAKMLALSELDAQRDNLKLSHVFVEFKKKYPIFFPKTKPYRDNGGPAQFSCLPVGVESYTKILWEILLYDDLYDSKGVRKAIVGYIQAFLKFRRTGDLFDYWWWVHLKMFRAIAEGECSLANVLAYNQIYVLFLIKQNSRIMRHNIKPWEGDLNLRLLSSPPSPLSSDAEADMEGDEPTPLPSDAEADMEGDEGEADEADENEFMADSAVGDTEVVESDSE
jgi:hypothetical protein